ncbi:hypothetical protein N9406_12335 [Verrucomicrobiales bacterium]|nr:hypothetical protein [Verrucomicrobiales bacterium]
MPDRASLPYLRSALPNTATLCLANLRESFQIIDIPEDSEILRQQHVIVSS